MKTKLFFTFFIFTSLIMAFASCKKDDKTDPAPETKKIVTAPADPVTDIDGNVYQTIKIGDQIWMAENLRVTKFRDGFGIAEIPINSYWADIFTAQEGKYCKYNNNADTGRVYGYLYNCKAANNTKNIAPTGWRLPTNNDWNTLIEYLGGPTVAGGKLKDAGFVHWDSPNTVADHESNFKALGSGNRFVDGQFRSIRLEAYFWIASNSGEFKILFADDEAVDSGVGGTTCGYSIRCIKE